LHCTSLANALCRLPNTDRVHYRSLERGYAAYQTPFKWLAFVASQVMLLGEIW
jgi:hypothetical protein